MGTLIGTLLLSIFSPVILWFDLQLIATKASLTVSGAEKCAL